MSKKILKIKNHSGFVILFAVTLAAILLAIAVGASNIALNEAKFATSARNTGNAFTAADTGSECALYYDLNAGGTGQSNFGTDSYDVYCAGQNFTISPVNGIWDFNLVNLGNGNGCAKVHITKTGGQTKIISKGYDSGSTFQGGVSSCSPTSNSVERELDVTYPTPGI